MSEPHSGEHGPLTLAFISDLTQLLTKHLTRDQVQVFARQLTPDASASYEGIVERVAQVRFDAEVRAYERVKANPDAPRRLLLAARHGVERAGDALAQVRAETAHAALRAHHARIELGLEVWVAKLQAEYLRRVRLYVTSREEKLDVELTLAHVEDLLAQLADTPLPPLDEEIPQWVDTSMTAWEECLANHPRLREGRRSLQLIEALAAEQHGEVAARVKARSDVSQMREEVAQLESALRSWLSERLDGLRRLRATCEVLLARQQELKQHAREADGEVEVSSARFQVAQHELTLWSAVHRYKEAAHELSALLQPGPADGTPLDSASGH